MHKIILISSWFIGLLLLSNISLGQSINIYESPAITELITKYTNQFKYAKKIKGWRIQFYSTADRRIMEDTKLKMESKYPDEKVVWGFMDPYFHLIIGTFRDVYSAQEMLLELRKAYPGSFLTVDEIEVKDFKDFEQE